MPVIIKDIRIGYKLYTRLTGFKDTPTNNSAHLRLGTPFATYLGRRTQKMNTIKKFEGSDLEVLDKQIGRMLDFYSPERIAIALMSFIQKGETGPERHALEILLTRMDDKFILEHLVAVSSVAWVRKNLPRKKRGV